MFVLQPGIECVLLIRCPGVEPVRLVHCESICSILLICVPDVEVHRFNIQQVLQLLADCAVVTEALIISRPPHIHCRLLELRDHVVCLGQMRLIRLIAYASSIGVAVSTSECRSSGHCVSHCLLSLHNVVVHRLLVKHVRVQIIFEGIIVFDVSQGCAEHCFYSACINLILIHAGFVYASIEHSRRVAAARRVGLRREGCRRIIAARRVGLRRIAATRGVGLRREGSALITAVPHHLVVQVIEVGLVVRHQAGIVGSAARAAAPGTCGCRFFRRVCFPVCFIPVIIAELRIITGRVRNRYICDVRNASFSITGACG